MAQPSDRVLLERLAATRDRDVLDQIVRRYFGFVYSTARRQVRDPHLAADITQAVFIVLVRKAGSLKADTVMPAWLFTVTRHAVANVRRVEARRRLHETKSVMMSTPQPASAAANASVELADEIRSVLDDGLAQLGKVDRQSLLLHFLDQRTHREVGEALGMSEEAVRKRISRALDRLRSILSSRAAATTIAGVMAAEAGASAGAAAAHEAFVASTVNVAWLSGSVASTPPAVGAIARGVLRRIALARVCHVATACVALVLIIGIVAPLLSRAGASRVQSQPALAIAAPVYATRVGANTTVQILGVSSFPPSNDTWFAADGTPIDLPHPRTLGQNFQTAVPPQFAVAVQIEHPTSDLMRLDVPGSVAGSNLEVSHENDQMIVMAVFSFADAASRSTERTTFFTPWTRPMVRRRSSDRSTAPAPYSWASVPTAAGRFTSKISADKCARSTGSTPLRCPRASAFPCGSARG